MPAIQESILSPLTSKDSIRLLRKIPTDIICQKYQSEYNIEVGSFFAGLPFVDLYQCLETGYQFYYPFYISGDSRFYEQLQAFPWYYMPWKWEHQTVFEQINPGDRVLEIGCAAGAFLEKLSQKPCQATGLEQNKYAIKLAQQKKLDVLPEPIETHALQKPEYYDVLCSFQVMEHVPNIGEVLKASWQCLKPGGRLFMSVPNMRSFLGLDEWNTLNLPPHHMGLWDQKALESLAKVLPLKLLRVFLEPLQPYHKHFFKFVTEKTIEKQHRDLRNDYGLWGKFLFHLKKRSYLRELHAQFPQLANHTIIAEYSRC